MPALALWLGSLFGSLVAWLAKVFTQRVAIAAAAIAAIVGLTAGFMTALSALVSGVVAVMPSFVTQAAGLFLPDNTRLCISAYAAAKVAAWIYTWKVKAISLKARG